jgi:hypothetical protein
MSSRPLRFDLPALPPRLTELPVDDRGYPVPWFVAWVDGKPDHRCLDSKKLQLALRQARCWMCGEPLGSFRTFCIGPMCCVTRTISEPPSHLECLRYAVRACPFLTRPHAHRREKGLPEDHRDPPGVMLKRNPGVSALWTTRRFVTMPMEGSVLFRLGEPDSIEWWAEGRSATLTEVTVSVTSGLPLLEEEARRDRDPEGALRELRERVVAVGELILESFAQRAA